MRFVSCSVFAFAVAVVGLVAVSDSSAQIFPTPVKDLKEFKRDYFTDRPITYSPDDPCYRGKIFQLHTNHYGKFSDCDQEEMKRYSPYIYWTTHCEPDFVPYKSCLQSLREDVAKIRRRVSDGAGDCCQQGCDGGCGNNQCQAYQLRCRKRNLLKASINGSRNLVAGVASSTAGLVSKVGSAGGCNTGHCSTPGGCSSEGCASASTGCSCKSCRLGIRGNRNCAAGNCAPQRGVPHGCNSGCDCGVQTDAEGPSGLISPLSHPALSRAQGPADAVALSFVQGRHTAPVQSNARNTIVRKSTASQINERLAAVRSKANSIGTRSAKPDYSVLTQAGTHRIADKYAIGAKRPCNCAKCQLENGNKVAAPTAQRTTEKTERAASNSLIERIRGLTRL